MGPHLTKVAVIANVIANPILPSGQRTPSQWFNTADFVTQGAGNVLTQLRYRYFPDHLIGEILTKRWIDNAIRVTTTVSFAMPAFWLGLMLALIFGLELHWFPVSGYSGGVGGILRTLTLPALALGLRHCRRRPKVSPNLTCSVVSSARPPADSSAHSMHDMSGGHGAAGGHMSGLPKANPVDVASAGALSYAVIWAYERVREPAQEHARADSVIPDAPNLSART